MVFWWSLSEKGFVAITQRYHAVIRRARSSIDRRLRGSSAEPSLTFPERVDLRVGPQESVESFDQGARGAAPTKARREEEDAPRRFPFAQSAVDQWPNGASIVRHEHAPLLDAALQQELVTEAA